jgi:glycerophosphoryl diester phosphodiesterase
MANQLARSRWLSSEKTLIIGHRGASLALPENTLAAFALAVEQGADGVELDVRLSKDGRAVLMHDANLQRVSGNPARVCDLTIRELKQIDLGMGQTIPLLAELFELTGDSTLYNIELKEFGLRDLGLVDAVAQVVDDFGLQEVVLLSSFNPLVVRRARRQTAVNVPVALIRGPGVYRHTKWLINSEVENPHHSLVDESYMAGASRDRRAIYTWTVDDLAEAQRLFNLGVQGIITNEPDRLLGGLAL